MAKRIVRWTLLGSVLGMSKIAEGDEAKNAPIILEAEFDLVKLFPDFLDYNDVQKQLVVYGTKQKLADVGASEIADFGSKIGKAKLKWDELLAGKWSGSRVNATGAAENKKLVATMKEASKVISLEGLVMKKVMSKLPGQEAFTEEDEAKLQELLKTAAEAVKPKK